MKEELKIEKAREESKIFFFFLKVGEKPKNYGETKGKLATYTNMIYLRFFLGYLNVLTFRCMWQKYYKKEDWGYLSMMKFLIKLDVLDNIFRSTNREYLI